MDMTTAWQLFISLGVFTALGVSLVNAYSRRQANKAAEPHEYAKSYQVVVQTRNNLAKALEEEQRQNKLNQEELNKKLDEISVELSGVSAELVSVQEDAATYSRTLQIVQKQNMKLSREYKELKREHENLQAQYRALKKSVNNN